jgi:hypothetical protein
MSALFVVMFRHLAKNQHDGPARPTSFRESREHFTETGKRGSPYVVEERYPSRQFVHREASSWMAVRTFTGWAQFRTRTNRGAPGFDETRLQMLAAAC